MGAFKELKRIDHHQLEEEYLAHWASENLFEHSIATREGAPTFTFYEGPPTANGRPGIHHVMSRTIKDLFCRYKTMQGFRVERKAGWDTHGLPVEIEVEKALGLEGRHQVEAYGVEKYNAACRESVLKYTDLWDTLTTRMGYWVDLENPYITFKNSYIESVWWLIKQMDAKALLYRGFKIQWYSPGSNTVLSSHEVSLGYKEVQDPSVVARFRDTQEDDLYYLAWTTTPWTLISNVALAVGADIPYVIVRRNNEHGVPERLVIAEARIGLLGDDIEVLERLDGRTLVGKTYRPVYAYFSGEVTAERGFRIVAAPYVTTEDGTGIVHTAPAFGAEDYETAQREGLPMINPVEADGRFSERAPIVAGMWFKDADRVVVRDLRERGLLFRHDSYVHNYPHDWRKGTPLMSYPVESWFVRTTALKQRLMDLNDTINWQPQGIGTGRFGEWLRNNVDWALSRRRYWGTPLPIWVSDDDPSYYEVIGSIEELREKAGDQIPADESLDLHRPFIDSVTWTSPSGATMRRVPDLIDVWFDSGAMPFAQWHYPFENKETFERTFPADFIAEGVDQTRGWFYTLHAIAACVMDSVAYKNVVVNGLVLDENGEKMSKSKGNTVDPFATIDKHGADVVRWTMMSTSPPWENTRFSERGLEETSRKFFATITNVYAFFATYANVDGYNGAHEAIPYAERSELDRWILHELQDTVARTTEAYDQYNPTRAARAVEAFVDSLSNWYIRRSRRRFWSSRTADQTDTDKQAAYDTVAETLIGVAQMMAPIAPFYGDWLYRQVNSVLALQETASVHLSRYPVVNNAYLDEGLGRRMRHARAISSLVLGLRNDAGVNVRQPLAGIMVVTNQAVSTADIEAIAPIVKDEVNVHLVATIDQGSELVQRSAKANFKVLGKKLGSRMKQAAGAIEQLAQDEIAAFLANGSLIVSLDGEPYTFVSEDITVTSEGIEGWSVGQEGLLTVALDMRLTSDLRKEGLSREIVNRIQNMRKAADFQVTDRIIVNYMASEGIQSAIERYTSYIQQETLAVSMRSQEDPQGSLVQRFEFEEGDVSLAITVSS